MVPKPNRPNNLKLPCTAVLLTIRFLLGRRTREPRVPIPSGTLPRQKILLPTLAPPNLTIALTPLPRRLVGPDNLRLSAQSLGALVAYPWGLRIKARNRTAPLVVLTLNGVVEKP